VNERLYRSVDERVLAGVCGGLADRLGVDPTVVRIVWVLLTLASNGVFLLIYIVMAIVVPEEDVAVFPPPPGFPGDPGAPLDQTGAGPGDAVGGAAPGVATGGSAMAGPTPPGQSYWIPPAAQAQSRAFARAQRRAARAAQRQARPGQASLVLGIVLILLGAWFLLEQYVPAFDAGRFWPFIVIGLGVVLLAFAFGGRGGKSEGES
jgi:phage shock protein PspC (stress-responsive transcriptional regulator)